MVQCDCDMPEAAIGRWSKHKASRIQSPKISVFYSHRWSECAEYNREVKRFSGSTKELQLPPVCVVLWWTIRQQRKGRSPASCISTEFDNTLLASVAAQGSPSAADMHTGSTFNHLHKHKYTKTRWHRDRWAEFKGCKVSLIFTSESQFTLLGWSQAGGCTHSGDMRLRIIALGLSVWIRGRIMARSPSNVSSACWWVQMICGSLPSMSVYACACVCAEVTHWICIKWYLQSSQTTLTVIAF